LLERSERVGGGVVLVRIIALSCSARFTTFHKVLREAGSNPVLGSSAELSSKNYDKQEYFMQEIKVHVLESDNDLLWDLQLVIWQH